MCLRVGESKKDKMGAALQGGAIIKVGGQYSNAVSFILVSAPPQVQFSPNGVWHPVVCPQMKRLLK